MVFNVLTQRIIIIIFTAESRRVGAKDRRYKLAKIILCGSLRKTLRSLRLNAIPVITFVYSAKGNKY
jgi:hypothetical protein